MVTLDFDQKICKIPSFIVLGIHECLVSDRLPNSYHTWRSFIKQLTFCAKLPLCTQLPTVSFPLETMPMHLLLINGFIRARGKGACLQIQLGAREHQYMHQAASVTSVLKKTLETYIYNHL